MNSSVATQRDNSLQRELSKNESRIAGGAMDRSNAVRSEVNSQKGQLMQQLNASANPQAITAQADAATSQLRAPSSIQPLGNLFADWSSMYLANQPSHPNDNVWNTLTNQSYAPGGGGNSSYMVN